MTASAGVGKENYNWWMKNVQLFPYTWDELMEIARLDYDRAIAYLTLEEHRNRKLPPLKPVETEEEYHRLDNKFQKYLIKFIRDEEIFTVPDYLVPRKGRAWANVPTRQGGTVRDFFEQCKDSHPLHMG